MLEIEVFSWSPLVRHAPLPRSVLILSKGIPSHDFGMGWITWKKTKKKSPLNLSLNLCCILTPLVMYFFADRCIRLNYEVSCTTSKRYSGVIVCSPSIPQVHPPSTIPPYYVHGSSCSQACRSLQRNFSPAVAGYSQAGALMSLNVALATYVGCRKTSAARESRLLTSWVSGVELELRYLRVTRCVPVQWFPLYRCCRYEDTESREIDVWKKKMVWDFGRNRGTYSNSYIV